MSDQQNTASDLIYQLEDKPPFLQAIIGAVTHLLAIFVPMVTPVFRRKSMNCYLRRNQNRKSAVRLKKPQRKLQKNRPVKTVISNHWKRAGLKNSAPAKKSY